MRERGVVNVQRAGQDLADRSLPTRPVDRILVAGRVEETVGLGARRLERAEKRANVLTERGRQLNELRPLAESGEGQVDEEVVATFPPNVLPLIGSGDPTNQGERSADATEDLVDRLRGVELDIDGQASALRDEVHQWPQKILALLENLLAELNRRNAPGPGQRACNEGLFLRRFAENVENTRGGGDARAAGR